MLHRLENFLFGTLRGRLILSVALVHAVMMTLFIVDLTIRQRNMLLENQTSSAVAMSESLATSAAEWIAADDISGLQELVEAQRRYPEIRFVIFTDDTGHILAHTDKSKVGLYLLDLPSTNQLTVLNKSTALVDVAAPAMLSNQHIGWVRVGLGQKSAAEKLANITFIGVLYALAAIFIGSLIAWRMGSLITQRLYAVQDTISDVKKGNQSARANLTGNDEAASIAREFNSMLDTLKMRESELSASESRFKNLFNAAAIPLCFINNNGALVDSNERFVQTFGYTHHDVPTLNEWWQNAYPDSEYRKWAVATWKEAVQKAAKDRGDIEPVEYNVTCKNGDVRTMVVSGTTLNDDLLATFFDITERKRAEEALQKNNILLERIFSSTEFMTVYMDTNFNFIRVNRAYAEADAHTPEFFVGKNHFDLYPNAENEAIFRKVVESGEPYIAYAKPFEYAKNPERGITYWNWSLQPVKETDGRVIGLVFSLVDVTERERALIAQRESDMLYRTLVEQADDGIFVADPQGNYIDANPSGCAMLGYTREEILRLNMRDLVSPESQKETPIRFKELQDGKSVTTERMMITKSGVLLPVEINGKALANGNLLGVVRDITERKHQEIEREAIITVSNALRKATTRDEILAVILDQITRLFDADGTILAMPNLMGEGVVMEIGRGAIGEKFTGLYIPPGKGMNQWVIQNRKPYLNNHMHTDPLFCYPDLLGASHCVASVPLIAQESSIGAVWFARKKDITKQDLSLFTAIADIAANAIHRVMLHEQTEQQLHHLIALHQIDLAITANFELNITLGVVLHSVTDELNVDAASILLLDPISHIMNYTAGVGFKTRGIEKSRVRLDDPYAGRAALEYRVISCPDLSLERKAFTRFSLIEDENFSAYYAAPLIVKGQVKGVLEVFHHKMFKATADWLDYLETLATQAAIAIENMSLFENLQRSNIELMRAYDATIEGWSHALDLRDRETEGHTQRVTEMAMRLAEKVGMSSQDALNLRRGALLHDIGKMGIPDSILHKPQTLTDEEWEIMRQHPVYAYEMLSQITHLKYALNIPYCHHEKWDGSGYPRGLKGEEIPLAARVFAVVDVFDALTSVRPYRKAMSHEEAYQYIQEQSGKHFDPEIVKLFLEEHL